MPWFCDPHWSAAARADQSMNSHNGNVPVLTSQMKDHIRDQFWLRQAAKGQPLLGLQLCEFMAAWFWKQNRKYKEINNMSKTILYSQSEDNDEEILLPICSLFPPNELISKRYAPDIKPAFKVLHPQKPEKKRATIIHEQPHSFWECFGQADTLGYEYVAQRSKLAYLKFKSAEYMRPGLKGKQHSYLAGMFIPLEQLLAEGLKKSRNIYRNLANIQYVENKLPLESSFSANCYTAPPHLRFTSNYESSNLFAAFKTGQCEYDLILQNDTNSRGNTQWFNFTVEISQDRNYKFNIVNLTKSTSLYQKGMTIAYHSQSAKANRSLGWTKGCHSITYKSNSISREDNQDFSYYTLHFQYRSPYKNDFVTFSYSFPYTTLELQRFFNKVMLKRVVAALKIQKVKIAQTLTGFPIYAYKFSHKKRLSKKSLSGSKLIQGGQQGVPSAVFMARQHPGESQGSYIAEGVVEWLLQGDFQSWKKSYQFYVIPMVNMDGVYYGNYRTNLSGNDLNRIWRQPRKDFHCQIYSLKKFLCLLNKTNPISLIIDIHGHSSSLNSFFYGNPPKKEQENTRVFPYYCAKKVKQISYMQSTFSVSQDKKACARVVLSEMFPKAMVYTFQTSFYGWKKGKIVIQHTIESYRKLGRDLVQCFVEYSRLAQKNSDLKQRWSKQIDQVNRQQSKGQSEQIFQQSDEEAQRQLIQFPQLSVQFQDNSEKKLKSPHLSQPKKKTPSIGKSKPMKYIRRHSPLKLKSYYPNQTYLTEKEAEPAASESQGFLSIVKINTKPYIDSASTLQNLRKKSTKREKSFKLKFKQDSVLEQPSGEEAKENNERFTKGSKLMGQKELVLERQRQARVKLQQTLLLSKSCNGFFRYNYIKKP